MQSTNKEESSLPKMPRDKTVAMGVDLLYKESIILSPLW